MKAYAASISGKRDLDIIAGAHVKVYAAVGSPAPRLPLVDTAPPVRILVSYVYDQSATPLSTHIEKHLPLDQVDLMVDSGAFSVWTVGKTVDLDAYIEWAKERRRVFPHFSMINLDVIPGAPGQPATKKERERAVSQSKENADRIRDAGMAVMEVFHLYDGSYKVMEDLWERRRPGEVLAIGGLAGMGTPKTEIRDFANNVFARVRDWSGGWENIVRLHGLGISPDAAWARDYPWWSIDSSSWNSFHRFGTEILKNGQAARTNPYVTGKSRTSSRPVANLYYIRLAKRWHRLEETYTQLWQDRGVTFIQEEALV